jgi:hypothetical protein
MPNLTDSHRLTAKLVEPWRVAVSTSLRLNYSSTPAARRLVAMRLSITQAVGRLGPAHRAAHRVADYGVKPGMKFCDRPDKALAGQLASGT